MNILKVEDLISAINSLMSEASDSLNKQINLAHNITSSNEFYDEEMDMEGMYFKSLVDRINLSFLALIEAMELPQLLKFYQNDFEKLEGKHTNHKLLPYIGEWHNETIDLFWKYHKTLTILLGVNIDGLILDEKKSQLERILINTPKIVKDRNIEPSNETEGKNACMSY